MRLGLSFLLVVLVLGSALSTENDLRLLSSQEMGRHPAYVMMGTLRSQKTERNTSVLEQPRQRLLCETTNHRPREIVC